MSLSKDIRKYDADWSELAERIATGEHIVLEIPSLTHGRDIRFNFYGFREALALHDPNNPWLSAVLACKVSFLDNPPRIVFGRGTALNTLLAGLRAKKPAVEQAPAQPQQPTEPEAPKADSHSDVLLSLGYGTGETLKKDEEK